MSLFFWRKKRSREIDFWREFENEILENAQSAYESQDNKPKELKSVYVTEFGVVKFSIELGL